MIAIVSHPAHQDGIILCPKFMREHLREGIREHIRLSLIVYQAVKALRPLQDDVRTMLLVEGHKALVQFDTLVLQHAHSHFYTGITQLPHPPAMYFGKRIEAATHHTAHPFAHNEVGTGRRLAVM